MTAVPASAERRQYQFDQFRVDPARRLLFREDEVVPVTPKVFSILLVLLEKGGEVVEKKELLDQVWPDSVVTEANLTQNISSLRKALGERASNRRYIVTLPGRGYSFVADVVEVAAPEPEPDPVPETDPVSEAEAAPAPVVLLEVVPLPLAPSPAARERGEVFVEPEAGGGSLSRGGSLPRGGSRAAVGLFLLLVIVAIAFSVARQSGLASGNPKEQARLAPSSVRRPSIAVLGFKNLSAAKEVEWLAPALAEMLTTELAAGGRVRVVSGENVARVRQSLSLPYSDSLDGSSLQRLHQMLNADRVVLGSYLALDTAKGRRVRLDLRIFELPSGTAVASMTEMGTEAELFDLVSRAGARLRRALHLAEPSPEQARAVQAMHPATPDAARLYAQGLARLRFWDYPGARDFLVQAAQADPSSAAIHTALSQTWAELGYDARAVEEARQALELSGPLSREERLAIEARLYEVSREWSRAGEIYRSLWTFFPDDLEYGLQLATCLSYAGRSVEAVQAIEALRRLPPPEGEDSRLDLTEARVAIRLSDTVRGQRAADAAVAKGRQSGETLVVAQALLLRGGALVLEGKPQAALPSFQEAHALNDKAGNRWGVTMALAYTGLALHRLGDLDATERVYLEALDIAQQLGSASGIAAQNGNLGRLYLDRGELERALDYLEKARAQFSEIEDPLLKARVLSPIGSILAARGDLDGAAERFEEVVAMSRKLSSRLDEGRALAELSTVLAWKGQLGEARRQAETAVQILRSQRHPAPSAMALTASADVLARLGDLEPARERQQEALQLQQKSGNRVGVAHVLGSQARLALRAGDLPRARKDVEEQLRLARETGARTLESEALRTLGLIDLAAGELARSRTSLVAALRTGTQAGEALEAAAARLDLARLDLAANQPAAAIRGAREVVAWAGPRGAASLETEGLAVLAEALLRQGDFTGALSAAERARVRVERSEDRELRVLIAPSLARVEAAGGDATGALRSLRRTVAEASRLGFVHAGLEARLAFGEIALQQGDGRTARGALEAVRRDAQERGFGLVARMAAGRTPPASGVKAG